MSIELVMLSNHLILFHPLLLLPSVFPSNIVFSNESALFMKWPKYWSFHFSIHPSNEYSELVSFGIDWLDLLAVQGTLKSVLQYHRFSSINSLVLSLLYGPTLTSLMTTGKTTALTNLTFIGKVISLLNMLSTFVVTLLPRIKHLLISSIHSDFGAKNMKSVTFSTSVCQEVMGLDAMILVFLNVDFQASFFTLLSHLHHEAL